MFIWITIGVLLITTMVVTKRIDFSWREFFFLLAVTYGAGILTFVICLKLFGTDMWTLSWICGSVVASLALYIGFDRILGVGGRGERLVIIVIYFAFSVFWSMVRSV